MVNKNSTFDEAFRLVWDLRLQFLAKSKTENQRYIKHISPILGKVAIGTITPFQLEQFKVSLLKKKLAPQTVLHILSLIKRTYNSLIEWGLFEINPAVKTKISLNDNKRYRFLTKLEANILLNSLKEKSELTWAISLLSLSTGMRAGEIFNLKGIHVDLSKKKIHVVDTKNKKNRIVYLPNSALKMLQELNYKKNQFIFLDKNNNKLTFVSKTFPRVVDQLGLNDGSTDARDKVVFHTLRHTYASWLVQEGKTLHVVGELLGHSTLEMTKRYAHLTPEIKEAAIETIDLYLTEEL